MNMGVVRDTHTVVKSHWSDASGWRKAESGRQVRATDVLYVIKYQYVSGRWRRSNFSLPVAWEKYPPFSS